MRITHVSDTYLPLLGGIEAQVSRLAEQQAAAGHAVEVLTTTPAARGAHGVTTSVEGGVTVHRIAARIPGGWPIHPRSTAHVTRRLREVVARGERPDVVHLHMGVLAPTVQAALRPVTRLGLPAVLTVHSVWGAATPALAALDRMTGWSGWPVRWTAVSELTAAPLRRIVARRGADVAILPNGLDLDTWRVPRTERAERPEGPAVHVVSAARFAPRKRMLPLLKAVADAAAQLPSDALVVTLAGDGPERPAALRFVAEQGLERVVALPGRLTATELKRLYARADVFAAPAVAEAFGLAALEAQAAGLTVVTRAGSGVAERVQDGATGLVVPDDVALATALVRLATEPALLDALLAAATDPASAMAWPEVLATTERTYAEAAALARA
ncbi:glycosyltransferase family 4 protein [Promicromonospora citrea]|uniref:D-inositol 3-phosphate glycosyltransferase n=1 Tax=Promicromonospora citrea TaxID=43677 RepID=A0A8H9L0W2_9MICO|nr:glycosyltransferase family 4 protein [Promicromonospora citrea]NNH51698.1 glycosyltransferase family 4 protein [Promicromonospora citrea]GGM13049.1 putative glycosyl transferase [Promicromonospora citrea]